MVERADPLYGPIDGPNAPGERRRHEPAGRGVPVIFDDDRAVAGGGSSA